MKQRKKPQRQCIACRESKDKNELVRVVKTPEGEIVLDYTGRQNGRGAYLCSNKQCLAKAIKTNALSRSFKMNVPQESYEELERQLQNDTE